MTNYERLISLSKEEMEQEITAIINWSDNKVKRITNTSNFIKDWLDCEHSNNTKDDTRP